MKREEFLAKIQAITEQGIAYANAHAAEIKAAQEESAAAELEAVLTSAEKAPKTSYESIKSRIASIGVSSDAYESAIRRLVLILGI